MTALDLFRLDGKVAVVTGGAKGIGMYYSRALAEAGAKVVVADIDGAAVENTTQAINSDYAGQVLGIQLDVTSRESIRTMIDAVDQKWGRLDILVNNAALFAALSIRTSPWGIPDDEFDRVLITNIRAIYACADEALKLMLREKWGRIINIASGLAFKGSVSLIHYAASKGAVVNLTYSMAAALGNTGITVNALAPGSTDSPTVLERRPPTDPVRLDPARIIRRVEIPTDLIGTLLYLASPASDFVTGQTVIVDGGTVRH